MVPRWSSSTSRRTRWLVLAVLCVSSIALAGFVGSTDAAPPPRPVCAGCGDAFAERAGEFGLDLAVTNSTARVTVHENGTAFWAVENALAEDAPLERLRANATLRSEIADARYWEVDVLSTSVSSDGVFTARYRDADFARDGTGDTLVSGAFTHDYGYRNLEGLGADRLVVVAPPGMQVEGTVPGATLVAAGTRTVLTRYDRGGFVTFVPQDATFGFLTAWLAVASILGPVVAINVVVAVLVPATVVGALVGVGRPGLRRVGTALDGLVADPARALVVVGVVGLAIALLGGARSLFGVVAPMVFGVSAIAVLAGVGWSQFGLPRLTYPRVGTVALVGAAGASGATLLGSVVLWGRVYWYGLGPRLPAFLALFALVPAGYAIERGDHRRGVLTAIAGVAVSLALVVPLTDQFWAFGLVHRLVFAVVDAVVLTVVGVPFLAVGALAATRSDCANSDRPTVSDCSESG